MDIREEEEWVEEELSMAQNKGVGGAAGARARSNKAGGDRDRATSAGRARRARVICRPLEARTVVQVVIHVPPDKARLPGDRLAVYKRRELPLKKIFDAFCNKRNDLFDRSEVVFCGYVGTSCCGRSDPLTGARRRAPNLMLKMIGRRAYRCGAHSSISQRQGSQVPGVADDL